MIEDNIHGRPQDDRTGCGRRAKARRDQSAAEKRKVALQLLQAYMGTLLLWSLRATWADCLDRRQLSTLLEIDRPSGTRRAKAMKCGSVCRRPVARGPDLRCASRRPGTSAYPPYVARCYSESAASQSQRACRRHAGRGSRRHPLAPVIGGAVPQVRAQSYANYQNRSLAAFGISLPGVPAVVGPFSNYDFRFMRSRTSLIFRVIAE